MNSNFKLNHLRHSEHILPTDIKKKVVKTIIITEFLHCCNIYKGCLKTISLNFNKLLKTFKNCVKFIYNLNKRDHVSEYKILASKTISNYIH